MEHLFNSEGQILDHINLRDLFPELDFVDALRKSSSVTNAAPRQQPPPVADLMKKAADGSNSGGSSGSKSLEATSQGGDTSSFGEIGQAELARNLSNGEFDDLATSIGNHLKLNNKDHRSEGEFSDLGFNIQEDGVGISVASLRKEDLLGTLMKNRCEWKQKK
jgi:hypothetical protein